jgi:hypothetical protein
MYYVYSVFHKDPQIISVVQRLTKGKRSYTAVCRWEGKGRDGKGG